MGETAKVMFCRIHISKKYVKNLSHTGERWTENCPPETSWKRFNKNNLTWQYVLKTCWRHLCRTSWRCLEDFFAKRLEGVLKTSWRHLKDVWPRRIYWSWSRRHEDVLKMSSEDVRASSICSPWSRRLLKTKTKDVTSSLRRMFAGKWFILACAETT